MRTTILCCGIVSALGFAITSALAQKAGDAVGFPALGEPQIIQLDDHTKLTLLGTSYGTRHMAPGYENRRTVNWVNTAPNTTVVWIKEEHEPGNRPSYELLVSDRANTGCVNIEQAQGSFLNDGVLLQSFVLRAFPRWDKETILRVKPYMGVASKEEFILSNSAPKTIAPWKSEALPTTKSDGDLEVTLTKLIAGAPTPHFQDGNRASTNDPANQCVHLNFDFRQKGQPTTNWQAWPVQTADATGNWTRGQIYTYPKNGLNPRYPDRVHPTFPLENDGFYYQPGLWPNQPWKVRLEFIQQHNFSDDEIVTFTNLPVKLGSQQDYDAQWTAWDVGKTNLPFSITRGTVNGAHLQLLPPLLLTNRWQSNEMDVSLIIGADPGFDPKGKHLTVVAATDDQGRNLWSFEQPAWAGHYSMEFARVHEDIKSLNLTLALHKSRFVEFTVQPARQ